MAILLAFWNAGQAMNLMPPVPGQRVEPPSILATAVWLVLTVAGSSAAGSFVAARLAGKSAMAPVTGSAMTTAHAAIMVAIAAVLATGLIATQRDPRPVDHSASQLDLAAYQADRLLRGEIRGDADRPAWAEPARLAPPAVREEVARILRLAQREGSFGDGVDTDRFYLSSLVQRYAGVGEVSALNRMDVAMKELWREQNDALRIEVRVEEATRWSRICLAAAILLAFPIARQAAARGARSI
ncbi:hypothetical protein [Antarcticirhabdus aurantiaca]|uniref:Uncharacterized protein n=1 Tax=Antarcticirhabdus aurantiaca TaxID=2606717 RepID=A0ACD4NL91_9HYPH|nr:hypothetical protein [Antarcticirhabdus aurantiaca]WAJ27395.1 hypothetical protein OXU80_21495 [Jeongeuplla avenae]